MISCLTGKLRRQQRSSLGLRVEALSLRVEQAVLMHGGEIATYANPGGRDSIPRYAIEAVYPMWLSCPLILIITHD